MRAKLRRLPAGNLAYSDLILSQLRSSSDAAIKRQAFRSEDNGPVPCSGLQSPLLQRPSGKSSAMDQAPKMELKLSASVPSLLQARRSIGTHTIFYCEIWVYS
jgi:hypothetical protein